MHTKILKNGSYTEAQQAEYWQKVKPIGERIEDADNRLYPGKRMVDILLGLAGTMVYFLLYPLIAAGIKLSSPGPVLFKQQRTGYRGEVFTCYKFRTMHFVDRKSKDGEPVVTQRGDSRIFGFGRFLRKANLDEFPQMLNVMKGEMSLVGPRPYPVDECRYWDRLFDDHCYRYTVIPGVTGYAQVKGYRGGTLDADSMRKRLDFDLIYTEKNNLLLDLKIILGTALQMVLRKTNGH